MGFCAFLTGFLTHLGEKNKNLAVNKIKILISLNRWLNFERCTKRMVAKTLSLTFVEYFINQQKNLMIEEE